MDKLIHRLFQWLKMFTDVEEQQTGGTCLWAVETPVQRRLVLKAFSVLPVVVRKKFYLLYRIVTWGNPLESAL